jgi:hypothetical protein
MIDFSLGIDRKQPHRPSEILPTLLGCHQKLLLENMRWRRPFSFKGEFEVGDDPVDDLWLFDKRDDFHLATACGTT